MQFLKKPCTIVQVSILSYFNLHDRKLCFFNLNKAQMSVVDQLWNIFVLSREKDCTKMFNFCIDSEFKLNALFFHLLIIHCLCDCIGQLLIMHYLCDCIIGIPFLKIEHI